MPTTIRARRAVTIQWNLFCELGRHLLGRPGRKLQRIQFQCVIDDGVSEIEYIYDDSGSGAVLSCVGKQSTTANLSGYYGFVVSGTAQTGGGGKYLSGSVYFNGGTLTATNVNGGINSTYGNTTATERIP